MAKTIKPIKHLQKKLQIGVFVSYGFYFCLIMVLTFYNFNHQSGPSIKIWMLQVVPLLLILPGMLMHYYRSYSWLCFVLLGYFIIAVEHSFMSNASLVDYVYLTLTVVLFVTSMFTSRWMQIQQKTSQHPKETI